MDNIKDLIKSYINNYKYQQLYIIDIRNKLKFNCYYLKI